MHVGALVIFEEPPPARTSSAATSRAGWRWSRARQELAVPRFEMGRPFWVDDPSFNLEYHVRHTALPRPGSAERLRQLVGRIFSQRLDRSKPLWELWLVQGLEGGRFALISKTHHALVDGVSGVDIATVLFDLQPRPAEVEDEDWVAEPVPSDTDLVLEGVKGLIGPRSAWPGARWAPFSGPVAPSSKCARAPRAWARWSGPGSTRRPMSR